MPVVSRHKVRKRAKIRNDTSKQHVHLTQDTTHMGRDNVTVVFVNGYCFENYSYCLCFFFSLIHISPKKSYVSVFRKDI